MYFLFIIPLLIDKILGIAKYNAYYPMFNISDNDAYTRIVYDMVLV